MTDPHCGEARLFDTGGKDRPEGHQIGVDARVGLHVGVVAPEHRLGMIDRQSFDLVDELAPGIETVTRGPLGILVRQPVAHGQQHRRRRVVLRGDELELFALIVEFGGNGGCNPWLCRADHAERRLERGRFGSGHGSSWTKMPIAQAHGSTASDCPLAETAPRWWSTSQRQSRSSPTLSQPRPTGSAQSTGHVMGTDESHSAEPQRRAGAASQRKGSSRTTPKRSV